MLRRFIRLLRRFLSNTSAPSRQQKWDRQWSKPDFAPRWQATQIPHVLQESIATNWLPRGGAVLDLGCGSGEIAAWIAGEGFTVVGIDFASAAIARARSTHQHENLRFEVVDICQGAPKLPQFDALFDRGCLHGLPSSCIEPYGATLASLLPPGGKFLLMHHTLRDNQSSSQDDLQEDVEQYVKRHLQPAFYVERTQPIDILTGSAPHSNTTIPGLAFWMVRR